MMKEVVMRRAVLVTFVKFVCNDDGREKRG